MRDRLIELIKGSSQYICESDSLIEQITDYLLDNGIAVPHCKKGDTVYHICTVFNEAALKYETVIIPRVIDFMTSFAFLAESKGLKRRNILMYKSQKLFERNLYGNIIYNMLDMEDYLKYLNQQDPTVLKALEVLEKEQSFPKAPEQNLESNHERTEKAIAKADSTRKKASKCKFTDDAFHCFA